MLLQELTKLFVSWVECSREGKVCVSVLNHVSGHISISSLQATIRHAAESESQAVVSRGLHSVADIEADVVESVELASLKEKKREREKKIR